MYSGGKKSEHFCPWGQGEKWRWKLTEKRHEELSFLMVKFHILIGILVTDACISQNSANIYLRFVYYIKYKFHIKREKQIIEF